MPQGGGLYFSCLQRWEDDNQRHIKAAFNFTECYGRVSAAHCVCTAVNPLGPGFFHGLKGLMMKKEKNTTAKIIKELQYDPNL